MKPRFSLFPVVAIIGLLTGPCFSQSQGGPDETQHFAEVKLRAYGTVSGERKLIAGSPQSSVLTIACESEPKARLLLAKYLSDLDLLPGVTLLPFTTDRGAMTAHEIAAQGVVLAARSDRRVYLFTAADAPSLKALLESTIPPGAVINSTKAEIPVPMYLDRWDKHGFRFYYAPFVKPGHTEDHEIPGPYDPTQDFTFAQQAGDAGLALWNTPESSGIMNLNSRQWVYNAAKRDNLPFGVNLGIGDATLMNRYPAEMTSNMDEYLGGWYYALDFSRTVAWSSIQAQNAAYAEMQPLVRDIAARYDNLINYMEPHEEMCHGVCDLLADNGPCAKAGFQAYLQSKYGTLHALATRWSQPGAFKSWDAVPFPEVATFLGWNSNAIDLTGVWKISFTAPYGADAAKPGLDDSSWPGMQAPGHAIAQHIPRKPAVFRRHFKIDPAWRAAHPRAWVYLWDLNNTRPGATNPKGDVLVFLNGKAIPENPPNRNESHWCALEVTSALADGDNVITLCLPQALIDYRCYLSAEAPRIYPALSPQLNAEWADFSDWICWSRAESVRRGVQMIRQVDPDRPITLASPNTYLTPIKAVAEDYGGSVHDTGGMAGSWNDTGPVMMESSGLPTDCEPGSGAVDLNDFKRFMGRWSTEATQGVDYFQYIGDIEWKPQVKDYFLKTLNLWHLMGKYHLPQAELAVLNSDRNQRLTGFPWNIFQQTDVIFAENRWWALVSQLLPDYPRAGIVEDDFARGNVDQYRVVLDANTTIMDPDTVDQIEKWVRKGGTFITYQQTGRHTSTLRDAWPITRLTGYTVTGIDKLSPNGDGMPGRHLHPVKGQTVFDAGSTSWQYIEHSAGLSLRKQDPACEDLLQWNDGSIAVGMRKLGKGMVFNLGCNSGALVPQVLEWLHVKHVAGSTGNRDIVTRHFISNNGLYDVWVLWNTQDAPVTATLSFNGGLKPTACHDVNTGEVIPIDSGTSGAKLSNVALDPWQTRAFLTPRTRLADASAEWFAVQRGWWRGTADPGRASPPDWPKLLVNLTDDWAFKPLDAPFTGAPPEDASLADPKLDDSSWKRMQLGIFDIPDYPGLHRAVFRKRFTIPLEWNHGKVLVNSKVDTVDGGGREYFDGQPVDFRTVNDKFGGTLTPGSSHLLAIDIWGPNALVGTRQPIFISYRPDLISSQPIMDHWAFAPDDLTYGPPASLPVSHLAGAWRTTAIIDASHAGSTVMIRTQTNDNHQHAVIFNGHGLGFGGNCEVNVTPWVKFGRENEIIVVCDYTTMQNASIDYYAPKAFP